MRRHHLRLPGTSCPPLPHAPSLAPPLSPPTCRLAPSGPRSFVPRFQRKPSGTLFGCAAAGCQATKQATPHRAEGSVDALVSLKPASLPQPEFANSQALARQQNYGRNAPSFVVSIPPGQKPEAGERAHPRSALSSKEQEYSHSAVYPGNGLHCTASPCLPHFAESLYSSVGQGRLERWRLF